MNTFMDQKFVENAVKQALTEKALTDLAAQITSMSQDLTKGFSRIETRQDAANGKLLKHELDIVTLDSRLPTLEEKIKDVKSKASAASTPYEKALWFAITTLVGLVTYLINKN
jgi:hypothetical protein